MKKVIAIFATLALFAIVGQNVNAQNEVTQSADAAANIVAPITLAKNIDLNFGNIAAGSAAGSVELSPAGVRTPTDVILPTVEGTVSAAEFTVTGLTGAKYVITLPTSSITITNPANDDMTIDTFIHNATELLTGGAETFKVGATLNLDADQATGSYTGSFDVTVDYE